MGEVVVSVKCQDAHESNLVSKKEFRKELKVDKGVWDNEGLGHGGGPGTYCADDV